MKVIFIKDLKGQGKKGEVKEVKDGYGQNFLIAKGYAVASTSENIAKLNREKKAEAELDKEMRAEALKNKNLIEKHVLVFKVKTGTGDKVFGSISPKQIKEELSKKGFEIDKKQIEMQSSAASLGYHKVNIKLYKEVVAELKIQLVK